MTQFKYDFDHLNIGEQTSVHRPIFAKKVHDLASAIAWAEGADISQLRAFLNKDKQKPLIVFGAGGSSSSCQYAAMLVNLNGGFATACTPMMIRMYSKESLINARYLCISASGMAKDINSAAEYLLRLNPKAFCGLTIAPKESKRNKLAKLMEQYADCTSLCFDSKIHNDGFVGAKKHVALFSLLYRSFYEETEICSKIFDDKQPSYEANCELAGLQDFNLLHGGLGEAAAKDLESRFVETGMGFSMVSCLKNFTHGRHTYINKHPECAIVLFETPDDMSFAEKIVSLYPAETPIIRIRSRFSTPLSAIELLVKSCYLALDLGLTQGVDPARPQPPRYGSQLYDLDFREYLEFVN